MKKEIQKTCPKQQMDSWNYVSGASGEPLNFQNYTDEFQLPNTCALIFWIVLPLVSKKKKGYCK